MLSNCFQDFCLINFSYFINHLGSASAFLYKVTVTNDNPLNYGFHAANAGFLSQVVNFIVMLSMSVYHHFKIVTLLPMMMIVLIACKGMKIIILLL